MENFKERNGVLLKSEVYEAYQAFAPANNEDPIPEKLIPGRQVNWSIRNLGIRRFTAFCRGKVMSTK